MTTKIPPKYFQASAPSTFGPQGRTKEKNPPSSGSQMENQSHSPTGMQVTITKLIFNYNLIQTTSPGEPNNFKYENGEEEHCLE
jgi:hypothetical protein